MPGNVAHSAPRFPATEMLRRLGNLPLGDPIRTAAMYEARARDCLTESLWNARAGHARAAWIFRRDFEHDMAQARETLDGALEKSLDGCVISGVRSSRADMRTARSGYVDVLPRAAELAPLQHEAACEFEARMRSAAQRLARRESGHKSPVTRAPRAKRETVGERYLRLAGVA
jgi:hypothetical protein